jgi:hypothetical protein
MTAQDVHARQAAVRPALRRAASASCQMEHRHWSGATPSQLARLPVLTDGHSPPWHYCPRCFTVFDSDGREVTADSV